MYMYVYVYVCVYVSVSVSVSDKFNNADLALGPRDMKPSSEAYEFEDRCFRVSVARRLMLPHPAAANPADVVQFCPNKSAAGVICNKPLDPK